MTLYPAVFTQVYATYMYMETTPAVTDMYPVSVQCWPSWPNIEPKQGQHLGFAVHGVQNNKLLRSEDTFLRGIWYLGGGGRGARLKLKKIVCRHKSQKKKFVENVGRKKVCCRNWWKNILTRKITKWVTYIIGKAYDKKFLQRNIKKNSSPPPPQISNGASLIGLLSYKFPYIA